MSIFAIADLHLDVKSNKKSMEVFGNRWKDYVYKLQKNWNALVSPSDTVIVAGDISWALKLEDAIFDLKWIDSLNGQKILLKGNHDFWWATTSKMKNFFSEKEINTISLLSNNAYEIEDYIIAGSRGWFTDQSMQNTAQKIDYAKIINRELTRLKLSLQEAKVLHAISGKEILVFLHFPPVWSDFSCKEILDVLLDYQIKKCYFGHIHGCYTVPSSFLYQDIQFKLISADYLDFIPQIV